MDVIEGAVHAGGHPLAVGVVVLGRTSKQLRISPGRAYGDIPQAGLKVAVAVERVAVFLELPLVGESGAHKSLGRDIASGK